MKLQLKKLEAELAEEKRAHECLKALVAEEKNQKESVALDSAALPRRLEQPLQQAKLGCQDIQEILPGLKRFVQEFVETLSPLVRRMNRMYNEQNDRLSETRALYRLEAQQRRLTYNTLIELRGNIRVFCRIRPIECKSAKECWLQENEDGELVAHLPNATKRKYHFDHIFHIDATQEEYQ
ncbi:unnamed protein product [Dicrocoelium dendriticum]|nr:unnamed protein product [Dicrocoelium dendriticum]